MTVEKCYEIMKGDYRDVLSRLSSDEKIKKLLIRFSNDKCFVQLCNAMESGDQVAAASEANILRGLSKNLSITALTSAAGNFYEALRGANRYGDSLEVLFKRMKKEYALAMACIQML